MIEQSILQAVSGKTQRANSGEAVKSTPETADKAGNFADVMLAQQDLEGDLLTAGIAAIAVDIDAPLAAVDGKVLPESGKELPDGEAPLDAPLAAAANAPAADAKQGVQGFAALKPLPELPNYRDIAILPPKAPSQNTAPAQATPSDAPAPLLAKALNAELPPQPAQAPTPPQATKPASENAIRPGDVQMVVTKGAGFSEPLANTSKEDSQPASKTGSKSGPESLLNLYGESAAKPATAPAPVQAASAPAPAPAITAPSASAPAQAIAPAPQAIETLVERLVQARETAQPGSARLSVANSDFGTVALRFETGASGLSVSMTNADPDFAATARTALAERVIAAGETVRSELGQNRGEQSGQQSGQQGQSAQSQAQMQHNSSSHQDPSNRATFDQELAANGQSNRNAADSNTPAQTDNPPSRGLYI